MNYLILLLLLLLFFVVVIFFFFFLPPSFPFISLFLSKSYNNYAYLSLSLPLLLLSCSLFKLFPNNLFFCCCCCLIITQSIELSVEGRKAQSIKLCPYGQGGRVTKFWPQLSGNGFIIHLVLCLIQIFTF